jgi:hypothetical protein
VLHQHRRFEWHGRETDSDVSHATDNLAANRQRGAEVAVTVDVREELPTHRDHLAIDVDSCLNPHGSRFLKMHVA